MCASNKGIATRNRKLLGIASESLGDFDPVDAFLALFPAPGHLCGHPRTPRDAGNAPRWVLRVFAAKPILHCFGHWPGHFVEHFGVSRRWPPAAS